MHELAIVERRDRVGELREHRERVGERERSARHAGGERLAVEELHRQERARIG